MRLEVLRKSIYWAVAGLSIVAAALSLTSASASAQGIYSAETCARSDHSVVSFDAPSGDRIITVLTRKGSRLEGMAHLRTRDGSFAARGPVKGLFGGDFTDERTGFSIDISWLYPNKGEVSISGYMIRGSGVGSASGFPQPQIRMKISTADACARWPQEYFVDSRGLGGQLPAPRFTCASGYVWREANPWDKVCVPPDARKRIALENADSARQTTADGGCVSGSFKRMAYPGDPACAYLGKGAIAAEENRLNVYRLINEGDVQASMPDYGACASFAKRAIEDAQKNVAERCGEAGPAWSPSFETHMNACMASTIDQGPTATQKLQYSEIDMRKAALFRCELRQHPHRDPSLREQPPVSRGRRNPNIP